MVVVAGARDGARGGGGGANSGVIAATAGDGSPRLRFPLA